MVAWRDKHSEEQIKGNVSIRYIVAAVICCCCRLARLTFHSKRSSPAGPAEQLAGGSLPYNTQHQNQMSVTPALARSLQLLLLPF